MDIDGVLADFNASYAALIYQQTGVRIDLPPLVWDYGKAAGVDEGPLWKDVIIPSQTWWYDLGLLPDAGTFLRWLSMSRQTLDVYFVTSRPGYTSKRQTEQWLEYHGFPGATVLIGSEKGLLAKGLGLDIVVDDKPDNLKDVKKHSPKTETWLFAAPYNEYAEESPYVDLVMPHLPAVMSQLSM